jgi:hypothetical protein
MEQSSSWEANGGLASQEIPRPLWNLKDHKRVQKGPRLVPILSQMHSVHTFYILLWNKLFKKVSY